MNWHETIEYIRTDPEYKELVRDAYFDPILKNNVELFGKSAEFEKTLDLIREYAPDARSILDIGAGNGISSINFALNGFAVTVVEPDPSETIGANAIRKLASEYALSNLPIHERFAEDIQFPDASFDIVYVRQAMHHAHDLYSFISEAARVLKHGGILLTIRDHVVFGEKDKRIFLEAHPLHKFYGGENAFSPSEYKDAFSSAGLKLLREIKYFDSVINYFPQTGDEVNKFRMEVPGNLRKSLQQKLGIISKFPFVFQLYKIKNGYKESNEYFERLIPGRMYSYILRK